MADFESLRMTAQPGSVAARAMAISSACAGVLARKLAAVTVNGLPLLLVQSLRSHRPSSLIEEPEFSTALRKLRD